MKAKSFLLYFFVVACSPFKLGAKARINSKVVVWMSLLLTLALAPRSYPAPLPINILDTQHTTSVSTWGWISGLEPVPEPSAFILFGLGSFALAVVRWRR